MSKRLCLKWTIWIVRSRFLTEPGGVGPSMLRRTRLAILSHCSVLVIETRSLTRGRLKPVFCSLGLVMVLTLAVLLLVLMDWSRIFSRPNLFWYSFSCSLQCLFRAPPVKKARSSLFASYTRNTTVASVKASPLRCTLQANLESHLHYQMPPCRPLLAMTSSNLHADLWAPCTVFLQNPPVELIFSHAWRHLHASRQGMKMPSWLKIRSTGEFCRNTVHRAPMSDCVLCDLSFSKCNSHLFVLGMTLINCIHTEWIIITVSWR